MLQFLAKYQPPGGCKYLNQITEKVSCERPDKAREIEALNFDSFSQESPAPPGAQVLQHFGIGVPANDMYAMRIHRY